MTKARIDIGEEAVAKKVFVWAIDWPGWCRGGKDRDLAIAALIDHAERYAKVANAAGLEFPAIDAEALRTVETVAGNGGTDFGVPSIVTKLDRKRVMTAEAERLASLVHAAWATVDRVAAMAPSTLRKGPRGGGRDTAKVVEHVIGADRAYAREIGVRLSEPAADDDHAAVRAERTAILEALRQPSDGSPMADRKWTLRYAARRIAWHALDHAWEIDDRTEPDP
ncbi:MAG: hypothetical protein ABIP77_01995 [Candidatus Limnocylindrales bacterium]